MEKLIWHTEQRQIKEPVLIITKTTDTLGRKILKKRCKKVCPVCGKEFLVFWKLRHKRKFCSQRCGGISSFKKNLAGYMGGKFTIKLNKSKEHIDKVRISLLKHYKNNPRNKEKWYIDKYGEGYIPKKLNHCNSWKTLSKELRGDYCCHRCGSKRNLDVHHIIPFAISKDNSLGNLVVLCRKCHKRVEDNNWGMFNLFNDWGIVRSCFRNRFLDIGRPLCYGNSKC